jgi:hypothetical protein
MSRDAKNSANRDQKLGVVLPSRHFRPRTLIAGSVWNKAHHERLAQTLADRFGQPITIVTKRGRRLASAVPMK